MRCCLECFNCLERERYTEKEVVLGTQPEICEICRKKRRVVYRFVHRQRRDTPADWFRRSK